MWLTIQYFFYLPIKINNLGIQHIIFQKITNERFTLPLINFVIDSTEEETEDTEGDEDEEEGEGEEAEKTEKEGEKVEGEASTSTETKGEFL